MDQQRPRSRSQPRKMTISGCSRPTDHFHVVVAFNNTQKTKVVRNWGDQDSTQHLKKLPINLQQQTRADASHFTQYVMMNSIDGLRWREKWGKSQKKANRFDSTTICMHSSRSVFPSDHRLLLGCCFFKAEVFSQQQSRLISRQLRGKYELLRWDNLLLF